MIVLALDQAKHTGLALLESDDMDNVTLIDHRLLTSSHSNYEDVALEISNKLSDYVRGRHIDIILLENVQSQQNPFTHRNLSILLGVLIKTCYLMEIPYKIISCNTWRKLLRDSDVEPPKRNTGRLKRDDYKAYSKAYVKEKYGLKTNDNIADSVCIGTYYLKYEVDKDE